MSHVFISYSHKDKAHLDKLITWLKDNGFTDDDLWYDKQIGSGNNWREEITTALNEAFAVLVLVTENSAKAPYCVYEWAYAMGQGTPTLPLTFDPNLPIASVPAPLASRQFVSCTDDIPSHLKEQLNGLRTVPPQVEAINRQVYNAIYDTHRRFFILGWLMDVIDMDFDMEDEEFREDIFNYFVEDAATAHRALQTLVTDKVSAFSSKQYRQCWKLMNFLHDFAQLPYFVGTYLRDRLFPKFDSEWLPAFEYFENDRQYWRKWIRAPFEGDLGDEYTYKQVFAEISRAFPYLGVTEIDMYLHNKQISESKTRESQDIDQA